MKFSIIGTGFIFPRHVDSITRVGGKIRHIGNTARGEGEWRDIVRKTDADCVVVLGPNDLHYSMTQEAAEAGKIVLCEKPLTIDSRDAESLAKYRNVFTVLQLRHHPIAKKLEAEINPNETYEIEMDISVYRDGAGYYHTWKGVRERSGGVLFIIGIHYFDMLLHLFGASTRTETHSLDQKTGTGVIEGKNYACNWKVSTDAPRDNQRRTFKINGVDYNFSSQDNLSYENLHTCVYEDLLQGKGIAPAQALPSIRLVEELYKNIEKA